MTGPDEKVALQAIEFWSTICDVEIAVKVEIEQVIIFRMGGGG
jgi:importin subunit beta-1